MLSGGERALTAVALLFAMLEVRPVPFCVLDEVDAALDEANIGRFADALRSLAHQTQFIVITHNRGTIEAADALYGVTVGDDSVSRVISLRLDEAQALAARDRDRSARGRVGFARCPSGVADATNRPRPRSTSRSTRRSVDPDWEPDPADFGVARRRHPGRTAARDRPSAALRAGAAGGDDHRASRRRSRSHRHRTPAWAESIHETIPETRGRDRGRPRGRPRTDPG